MARIMYRTAGGGRPAQTMVPATYGATSPGDEITPGSLQVKTTQEFQDALNAGVLDITLDAVVIAPRNSFQVPRIPGVTRYIRGTDQALIQRNRDVVQGTPVHAACIRAPDTIGGGSFVLDHIRCDGGWRSTLVQGVGGDVPFRFIGCDYLEMNNCVSCYSGDLGLVCNDTTQVILQNCTFFCTCTGAFSDDNVRDFLCQDCWFQFGGDDSFQWHQSTAFTQLRTNSVVIRHNLVRNYFGGKTHAGCADGTFNGKPSQNLWENNWVEASNRYGIEFNNSPSSGSWHGPPRNWIVRGNTFKNCTQNEASSRGGAPTDHVINAFLETGNSYDATCQITDNTFIREPVVDGMLQQDVYAWSRVGNEDKPAWVPGADAVGGGYWSQTGFVSGTQIQLMTKGVTLLGTGSNNITHSGNNYVGAGWTSMLG